MDLADGVYFRAPYLQTSRNCVPAALLRDVRFLDFGHAEDRVKGKSDGEGERQELV
jgi:hypothetical protein